MSVYANYDELVMSIHNSGRDYDMRTIEQAYLLANEAHGDQRRKSGEPYIVHPISVALILVELGMDSECITTALLHDVVEDTEIELSYIESRFGRTVAELVDGVTKLRKISFASKEEHQAENLRKMLEFTRFVRHFFTAAHGRGPLWRNQPADGIRIAHEVPHAGTGCNNRILPAGRDTHPADAPCHSGSEA